MKNICRKLFGKRSEEFRKALVEWMKENNKGECEVFVEGGCTVMHHVEALGLQGMKDLEAWVNSFSE